jgi:hypothetical protein
VAAPPGEVNGVECDIWPLLGRIVGSQVGHFEGVQAGGAVCVGGEGFAVRGGEPRPQDPWRGRVGVTSGVVDGVAGCSCLDEDERLFGGSVAFVNDGADCWASGKKLMVLLGGPRFLATGLPGEPA